jgi:hypothetical protein
MDPRRPWLQWSNTRRRKRRRQTAVLLGIWTADAGTVVAGAVYLARGGRVVAAPMALRKRMRRRPQEDQGVDIGGRAIAVLMGDAGSKACDRVENESHSEYETEHHSNYLRCAPFTHLRPILSGLPRDPEVTAAAYLRS